jgi:outer membrane protein
MTRKRSIVTAVTLAVLALGGVVHAQSTKIAVFDPQRVSEETEEGKRIKADLEAFQARKQAELEGLQQEVQTMRRQLTEQALSLSADRKAKLEKDIQRKLVELQSAEESANREFQLEIAEAQQQFQTELISVLDSFGRDEGFDLILDLQAVAFASPSVDVTTAIVDRFNAMVGSPGADEPESADAGADAGE